MLVCRAAVCHFHSRRDDVKLSTWLLAAAIGLVVTVTVLTDTWIYPLMATAGLLFVAFAIAFPRPALIVWVLLAPVANVYATVNLPGGVPDITFGRVAITVVSIALLMRTMFRGARLAPFGAVELAMLVLLAVMAFDVVRSGNPTSDALQDFDERVTPILLFLAARNVFGRFSDVKRALWALVFVGCYLAVHGGYQWATHGGITSTGSFVEIVKVDEQRVNESHLNQGRAVGPFSNGTEFGSVTAMAFATALFIALYQTRGLQRAIPIATLPLIGAAVIVSSTRSAWLGAYLGVVLMAWLDRRRRAVLLASIAAITIVGGATAVLLLPADSALEERAASLEPIRARLIMYNIGVRIAARRPLTGYGRGAPSRIAARRELYAMGTPDAELAAGQFHNIFMMTLVEWGVVALVAFVAILTLIVRGAIELRRRLAHEANLIYHFAGLFLAASVMFIVQGMFVDLTAFLYLNGLYFFLAGLTFAQLDATPARAAEIDASYDVGISLFPTDGSARA
jgi:O-antigen ligase